MQEFILFLLSFIFVFLIYQIFIVRRAKANVRKKKNKKEPVEIIYLQRRYKLDMKKISYNQLLQIVAIVSSLDIALSVSIIMLFNNFFLEIIGGFFSVIILILVSYHLVYLFYKKKYNVISFIQKLKSGV